MGVKQTRNVEMTNFATFLMNFTHFVSQIRINFANEFKKTTLKSIFINEI